MISAIVTLIGAGGDALPRVATLAVIFLVVILPAIGFWTLSGMGAARLLRTARAVLAFNLAMASLLLASLVPMLRDP